VSSGDFSIGSRVWPGTSKLIEEMGELQQVLGKLIATAGATDHWSGDLRKMLVEELGDVSAAVRFFARMNLTLEECSFVAIRSDNKLAKYDEWQLDPKPPPAATAPPCTDPTCPEHCPDTMGPSDAELMVAGDLAPVAPAPRARSVVQSAVLVAREMFRNDGAEGETVHLLCDELELRIAEPGYACKCGQFVAWVSAEHHGCYATPGPPVWPSHSEA
jgi:hypothetical protein